MNLDKNKLYQGKVLWFNKGFGIVKLESENLDIFIHHSNILSKSKNKKILYENELVEFNIEKQKNKLNGINVKSVNKNFIFETKNNINIKRKHRKKNTETFKPSFEPMDMRIITASGKLNKYPRKYYSNDIIIINDLFCDESDLTIYNKLLEEINNSGITKDKLWKLWHGDTHIIADDKKNWKKKCPTFNMIINKITNYFDMDVKATRFNWYKDSSQWKPYHHDAAAIKPDKAKTQNITVGVSFGLEREAAFEHAKKRTKIGVPLANGSIYVFNKDVNIEWRHGILQKKDFVNEGRISIIAWGKVKMESKK